MGAPEFLRKAPATSRQDPVIELSELGTLPNLSLLDARDDADFLELPVPGAVHVPVSDWTWAARNMGTGLDNLDFWQAQIDELGVGEGDNIAVFDDGRLNDAARVWFILQYFGLNVRLVNAAASELRRVQLPRVPWWPAARATLRPGTGCVALHDRQALQDWVAADRPVLDARSAAEHAGLELRGNPRGGHLPGAVSLPHTELMDGRRLRSPEDLRSIFAARGFAPETPFVTHCDRGGRSALTAIAALRAGCTPPAVYFLSFADWAADARAPLVT